MTFIIDTDNIENDNVKIYEEDGDLIQEHVPTGAQWIFDSSEDTWVPVQGLDLRGENIRNVGDLDSESLSTESLLIGGDGSDYHFQEVADTGPITIDDTGYALTGLNEATETIIQIKDGQDGELFLQINDETDGYRWMTEDDSGSNNSDGDANSWPLLDSFGFGGAFIIMDGRAGRPQIGNISGGWISGTPGENHVLQRGLLGDASNLPRKLEFFTDDGETYDIADTLRVLEVVE